jgi:16S rRNA (uracil1498-N3)-methyltransferase
LNLFYQPEIPHGANFLSPEESRHAVKVLRMKNLDTIDITDGQGSFYHAQITEANAAKCEFEILNTKAVARRPFDISIAVAPTKNIDRIEWFLEKAVEIGVERIYFMDCQNSERHHINHDRLMKIVISAMKQSVQAWVPEISELIPFKEILKKQVQQKFICHATNDQPKMIHTAALKHSHYLVLIGPEGDFSQEEIKNAQANNFEVVSLGPNRLRTETAALTACQILNFINM